MPSRHLELCVCLCESVCTADHVGVFVTMHVCVGVTVSDLVDAQVGMWVSVVYLAGGK